MAVAGSAVESLGRLGGVFPRRPAAWWGFARSLALPGWAAIRGLASLAVITLAIALLSAPRTEATPLERAVRRIAETVLRWEQPDDAGSIEPRRRPRVHLGDAVDSTE